MQNVVTIARLSAKSFNRLYPPAVLVLTIAPRFTLQVLFFALLGGLVTGEPGELFAFVGALAHVITISTLVHGPLLFLDDKRQGTLYRIRLSSINVIAYYFARTWMFMVEAALGVLVAGVLVSEILGMRSIRPDLLAAAPLYLAMIASTWALGMALALGVAKRAEVFTVNAVSYILLVTGGVVFSADSVPVLSAAGSLLPLQHGLEGVRATLAGAAWSGAALRELAVAVLWAAVAVGAAAVQARRAARHGFDRLV